LLKTIIIVALLAGAALAGVAFCAYVLKVDFAVNIMNKITEPFNSLLSGGNIDLQTVASGASLATAATSAIGWVKSNKDKALALKQSAETELQNSGLKESYKQLTDSKKDLEQQFNELKDSTTSEMESAKKQIATLKQENSNLQSTVNTLNELVPKIQKEKEIIKIVQ